MTPNPSPTNITLNLQVSVPAKGRFRVRRLPGPTVLRGTPKQHPVRFILEGCAEHRGYPRTKLPLSTYLLLRFDWLFHRVIAFSFTTDGRVQRHNPSHRL